MLFETIEAIAASQIGSEFVKEGVKFLWSQLNEVIKVAREKKAKKIEELPSIIESPQTPILIEPERAEQALPDLLKLEKSLAAHALDSDPEPINDFSELIRLQRILETIYGSRIQFRIPNHEVIGGDLVQGDKIVQTISGGIAVGKVIGNIQMDEQVISKK